MVDSMTSETIPTAQLALDGVAVPIDPPAPTAPPAPRLGDLLLRAGLVTDAQLLDALGAQREPPQAPRRDPPRGWRDR